MKHLVRHPRIQPFEPTEGRFGLDGVYQPIRLLGRGGSGQTWLCRWGPTCKGSSSSSSSSSSGSSCCSN